MARPALKPGEHGSVTFRQMSGRVEASSYTRDADGTRRRLKASGPTEESARDALVTKIALLNAGLGGGRITPATTVAELGILWLLSLRDKSTVTMESYGREVKRFITPALGDQAISEVTPAALEAFLAGRPGAAVRVSRVVLRGMFDMAVGAGAIPTSPLVAVQAPKAPPAPPKRMLTRVEYQRLLTHLRHWQEEETVGSPRSKDLHDQVVLLLLTGIAKAPEMLAATWEDINLAGADSTWKVTGAVERTDSGLSVRKYPAAEVRTIKLPGSAALMLRQRRATLGASRTGLVFRSRTDGPVDPANWRRTFQAACGDDFGWVRPRSLTAVPSV